jgi:uncharacterized protein (DUF58 family)
MSPQLYKLYRRSWYLKEILLRKLTPAGRFILVFCLITFVFGINTYRTMIYQLFSLSISLLILVFVFSFRFRSRIRIQRELPETCTAGQKLSYRLIVSNTQLLPENGLFFKENLKDPLPDFFAFDNSPEDGEEKRNWFDRRAGYYRWLWLIKKNQGANVKAHPLPVVTGKKTSSVDVSITPTRRGFIHFAAYTIFRHDPLGLVKSNITRPSEQNLLVLPKIYPIPAFFFKGTKKYQQGGIATAQSTGDSTEFVALRDYRYGDQVKHIDWKSTVRAGKTVVREYQDEYVSRYGLVLDTFCKSSFSQCFEEAVSVAASILMTNSAGDSILDLLFVGPEQCIKSSGKGIAEQRNMLEVLASVSTCKDKAFTALSDLLQTHIKLLSGLTIILIDMDESRKEFLEYLEVSKIPFKAILIVDSKKQGEEKINAVGLNIPVSLLEVSNIEQGLQSL